MDLLGMKQETVTKPKFKGFVLTARRKNRSSGGNRVNLFAMVPDWKISACKSSKEIVEKYGYERDGGRKLYVSVRVRQANNQGLFLEVDKANQLVREKHRSTDGIDEVAAWHIDALRARLLDRHPSSAWITASSVKRDGEEYFHYRYIQFTSQPRDSMLTTLIEQGTITLDHLIFSENGRTIEKGPLFKLRPENMKSLFPETPRIDLMSL
jgi:hypothetical protein